MKKIKPPFLSTSFSENGRNAKRRFTNILSTRRRKAGAALIAATLTGVLCFGALVACEKKQSETLGSLNGENIQLNESGLYRSIDDAVHAALLEKRDSYAETEFFAEGHIILGAKTSAKGIGGGIDVMAEIYAITSVGGYSFMNDMFIKDSGSGAIPAVIVLKSIDGGETYTPVEILWPEDGSYYEESIREMFPEEYHDKVLSAGDYYDELIEQEHAQAEEYLKSIGREAEIGDYADLNAVLPDMDTEASNYLLSIKGTEDFGRAGAYMEQFPIWKFPIYQGTHEYIQDGERYIYETNWEGDKSGGAMHYTVYDGDGKIMVGYSFMVNGVKVTFDRLESEQPVENVRVHPVK